MKEFLSPWTWRRWLTAFPECFSYTVIDIRKLREAYCKPQKSIFISSCPETEGIFLPLYDLPEALRLPYFQLKIQELLLVFSARYVPDQKTVTKYHSEQTELIRQIHDQLTKESVLPFYH